MLVVPSHKFGSQQFSCTGLVPYSLCCQSVINRNPIRLSPQVLSYRALNVHCRCFASGFIVKFIHRTSIGSPPEENPSNCQMHNKTRSTSGRRNFPNDSGPSNSLHLIITFKTQTDSLTERNTASESFKRFKD